MIPVYWILYLVYDTSLLNTLFGIWYQFIGYFIWYMIPVYGILYLYFRLPEAETILAGNIVNAKNKTHDEIETEFGSLACHVFCILGAMYR